MPMDRGPGPTSKESATYGTAPLKKRKKKWKVVLYSTCIILNFSSKKVIKKERREIGPCFPREAAFSQASSLLLLVDCSMTGFPVSWALLARLRSDPASQNLKSFLLPARKRMRPNAQRLSR
uniref:NADH dehydrogenase subunit 1 n=2 Tax=Pentapetalae TaxID=1437201 RepID=A0A872PL60_GLYUR|nr:orf96 [Bupleurum falcatum]YP_010035052.1 orf96 [Glycyrrhiza uralensis]ARR27491.1 orf96 [Bupleurum falcatum]QOX10075.1 orf96 [Glycyrrhiza uralensis]QVY59159.1 NADH dehydrogenase subunit 1 [Glycyrrhiza uralensis]